MPDLTGLRHFHAELLGSWSRVRNLNTGQTRHYWRDLRIPRFLWARGWAKEQARGYPPAIGTGPSCNPSSYRMDVRIYNSEDWTDGNPT